MTKGRRLALAALALVALYAAARLADPEQRWAALQLGGDRVEHLIVAYLVVALVLVVFPRVKLWTPALAFTAFGAAVELVQDLPFIIGAAQWGDVVSDAAGAFAATLPMWLARQREAPPSA